MRGDKDKQRGLYEKYRVERTDGSSSLGSKHEHCRYFVLDITHDQFAIPAITAYAKACEKDFPQLAKDLKLLASEHIGCPECGSPTPTGCACG